MNSKNDKANWKDKKMEKYEKDSVKAEELDDVVKNSAEKKTVKPKLTTDLKESDSERKVGSENESGSTGKKEKRLSTIELKDKSDLFKEIIDIALRCERLENDRKRLREKCNLLQVSYENLTEECGLLQQKLKAGESIQKAQMAEINELKTDVAHRNEVIDIVKADKNESALEFRNALAAKLKMYYSDFIELKEMGVSDDVCLAIIETFEGVIKVLERNGIVLR